MEKSRSEIATQGRKIALAQVLRNWQRRSVARRCTLSALAKKHACPLHVLKNMMVKGPRKTKRKAATRKTLLKTAKSVYSAATAKNNRVRKPVRPNEQQFQFSERTMRRLLSGLRGEHRRQVAEYWRKWHADNPNTTLSQEQFDRLCRCSQHW